MDRIRIARWGAALLVAGLAVAWFTEDAQAARGRRCARRADACCWSSCNSCCQQTTCCSPCGNACGFIYSGYTVGYGGCDQGTTSFRPAETQPDMTGGAATFAPSSPSDHGQPTTAAPSPPAPSDEGSFPATPSDDNTDD